MGVPVGSRPVPHRGYPTPMYRPELCARPGFQPHGTSSLCHPLRLPSGAWDLCGPAIGYPMTPHVYSWASVLGLWGTGNRVRISPITGGGGRWSGYHTIPDPTFGTRSQGGFSPDLSGSPNRQSPESTLGMFGSGSSDSLSAIALPVECGASADLPAHPASPAAQRMWGTRAGPSGPRHHPGRRST
jgi:hypothetical protein